MSKEAVQIATEELPSETIFQRIRTRATYLIGSVLFFLPFINIQCVHHGEIYTHTQSGLQMAFGGTAYELGGERQWELTGELREPWMMAYGLFLLLAVASS